jgi:uncharacterized membrane protein
MRPRVVLWCLGHLLFLAMLFAALIFGAAALDELING